MTSHILVIGETQSGKTHWANKFHQGSDGTVSVFFNTNLVPDLWGPKASSLPELVGLIKKGHLKVVFNPHGGMTKEDQARAARQLQEIINWVFSRWSHTSTRWLRLTVDEAQHFEDECQFVAARGLGKHVQLVAITQYPIMVNTTTRSNMPVWVIFRTGFQMEKFFQGFGDLFPRQEILEHTASKWHFMTFDKEHGWVRRTPV